MPTVTVDQAYLFDVLGRKYSTDEFRELCFEFGIELEEDTSELAMAIEMIGEEAARAKGLSDKPLYKIDISANRYDLLCPEGLARSLRIFQEKTKPPVFKIAPPKTKNGKRERITISAETAQIRPHIVGAILRDITFTQAAYDSFIELQEKLHNNICRKRTLVAIGTHDLDTLQGPFTYEARKPTNIKFKPLNQSQEMNAAELMEYYDKNDKRLAKFLPIIRDSPVYPVVCDAKKTVCSLPPIINGDHSKISLKTHNVFIECTATDLTKAKVVLNTMVAMFSEYCKQPFTVEEVEVVYPDGTTHVYPDVKPRKMQASIEYINSAAGLKLTPQDIVRNLQKMSLIATANADGKNVDVEVPITRSDIMHECDVMEDVAVAYGFNRIPRTFPSVNTVGKPLPINKLSDLLRRELALSGFTEVLPLILCSHDENFAFLRREDSGAEAVVLANPKTVEYQVVRTSLLPGILKTIRENRHHPLPLRVFEISDIVYKNDAVERRATNERRLCIVNCDKTSGFEVIHGLLCRVMKMLNVGFGGDNGYRIKESNNETYFPGRRADIIYSGRVIGQFGILHPEVLENFKLGYPCTALEMNIEPFFDVRDQLLLRPQLTSTASQREHGGELLAAITSPSAKPRKLVRLWDGAHEPVNLSDPSQLPGFLKVHAATRIFDGKQVQPALYNSYAVFSNSSKPPHGGHHHHGGDDGDAEQYSSSDDDSDDDDTASGGQAFGARPRRRPPRPQYAKQGELQDFLINPTSGDDKQLRTGALQTCARPNAEYYRGLMRKRGVFVNEPLRDYSKVKSRVSTKFDKPLPHIGEKHTSPKPIISRPLSPLALSKQTQPKDPPVKELPRRASKVVTTEFGELAIVQVDTIGELPEDSQDSTIFDDNEIPTLDFGAEAKKKDDELAVPVTRSRRGSLFKLTTDRGRAVDPLLLEMLDAERDISVNTLLDMHAQFDLSKDEEGEETAFKFVTDFMLLQFMERYMLTGVSSIQYATQLKLISDMPEAAVMEQAYSAYQYTALLSRYLKRPQMTAKVLFQLMTILEQYNAAAARPQTAKKSTDDLGELDTAVTHLQAVLSMRQAMIAAGSERDFTLFGALMGHLSRIAFITGSTETIPIIAELFLPRLIDGTKLKNAPHKLVYGVDPRPKRPSARSASRAERANSASLLNGDDDSDGDVGSDEDNQDEEDPDEEPPASLPEGATSSSGGKRSQLRALSGRRAEHEQWQVQVDQDPRIALYNTHEEFCAHLKKRMDEGFSGNAASVPAQPAVASASAAPATDPTPPPTDVPADEQPAAPPGETAASRPATSSGTSGVKLPPVPRPASTTSSSLLATMMRRRKSASRQGSALAGRSSDDAFVRTESASSSGSSIFGAPRQQHLLPPPRDLVGMAVSCVVFLMQHYTEVFESSIYQYQRRATRRASRAVGHGEAASAGGADDAAGGAASASLSAAITPTSAVSRPNTCDQSLPLGDSFLTEAIPGIRAAAGTQRRSSLLGSVAPPVAAAGDTAGDVSSLTPSLPRLVERKSGRRRSFAAGSLLEQHNEEEESPAAVVSSQDA
ncbi:phenylalanine--tRNA ligase subunit beta [Sorochytrium milnesiophthora]